MNDMMLVEQREFFEPEPEEFSLDDEERYSKFTEYYRNHFYFFDPKININRIIFECSERNFSHLTIIKIA